MLKHCIPIVYRLRNTVSVYPKSILLPHYVQSIRIGTFFSENRLSILGFDSHDVRRKIMKKYDHFEKKNEILDDALFEHDDEVTILKHFNHCK